MAASVVSGQVVLALMDICARVPVPHPPSTSLRSDPSETRFLKTVWLCEGGYICVGERRAYILRPYPLFPVLAIRRRYLALCVAREVQRAETIKPDRHSNNRDARYAHIY